MTELSGSAWAPSDDDGTGQSGTPITASWLIDIKDSIDLLIHSITNPTVTPEDIIDEVIAARGGFGSLDARLDGVPDYLTGLTDLGGDFTIGFGRRLFFADPDVNHGMTSFAATDQWGGIIQVSGTKGGMAMFGASDALDGVALRLSAVVGDAAPTATPMEVFLAKKDGVTVQALAAGEEALDIYSGSLTRIFRLYGNGSTEIAGGLIVGFAGVPGDDEIQIGDSAFKLDYVSATVVRLQFEANANIEYDRTANTMTFQHASGALMVHNNAGLLSNSGNYHTDGGISIVSLNTPEAGGILMQEKAADHAAPAANEGVLYLKDSGGGKTQLCIRFNTGAVQVIATQP